LIAFSRSQERLGRRLLLSRNYCAQFRKIGRKLPGCAQPNRT
jgi:hypothetical protein